MEILPPPKVPIMFLSEQITQLLWDDELPTPVLFVTPVAGANKSEAKPIMTGPDCESPETAAVAINEVQLLLAEKRTSLAVMRTGIAVLALPLSVMGLLIATSRHYDIIHVLHLMIPLGAFLSGLVYLGTFLVLRSIKRMRHYDELIREIKLRHSLVADLLD